MTITITAIGDIGLTSCGGTDNVIVYEPSSSGSVKHTGDPLDHVRAKVRAKVRKSLGLSLQENAELWAELAKT